MKIIHFIQVAHPSTMRFIQNLKELLGGDHLVVNQDPWAMQTWVAFESLPVYKSMKLHDSIKNRFKPDLVLDYTGTMEGCLQIGVNTPPGDGLTTAMLPLDRYEASTHYLDPSKCHVVDLGRDDVKLDGAHLAFQVVPAGEEPDLRVITECMARAIPVVVNKTKLTSRTVMNGVNGLMVADPSIVDEAVTELIHDPATRYEFGQSALQWVQENADIQSVVQAIKGS